MTQTKMPALFIGHGSPMNAIDESAFSKQWFKLAKKLPVPKAILCISAHWETKGVFISSADKPETIHDFGGFPRALHEVDYKVKGDAKLAQHIADLVSITHVKLDDKRGLDHGSWGVLLPMYPSANIPVLQLSLDRAAPNIFHYKLGEQLSALRDEGVLIICSGNIVHNLRMYKFDDSAGYDWAEKFNEEVKGAIISGEHQRLIDYQNIGPEAALAAPTPEHFLPLLYLLGLKDDDDEVAFFNDEVQTSISMTSVIIGL